MVRRQGREALWGLPASRESGKTPTAPEVGGGAAGIGDTGHRGGRGQGTEELPPRHDQGGRNTVRAGRTPEAAPSHQPAALSPAE